VSESEHHVAASLVRDALTAVFDRDSVSLLREDSPLVALGMTDADMVCFADALAASARAQGRGCVLADADLEGVATVADLIGAVVAALAPGEVGS